jgi:hypothetical protein
MISILIIVLGLGLWEVAANLWYVGEGGNFLGYCWGTMQECLGEEL